MKALEDSDRFHRIFQRSRFKTIFMVICLGALCSEMGGGASFNVFWAERRKHTTDVKKTLQAQNFCGALKNLTFMFPSLEVVLALNVFLSPKAQTHNRCKENPASSAITIFEEFIVYVSLIEQMEFLSPSWHQ